MAADGNISQETINQINAEVGRIGSDSKNMLNDAQKALVDARALIESSNKSDVVLTERIDKFVAEAETKHANFEAGVTSIKAEVEKLQTALNRTPGGFTGEEGAKEAKAALEFEKIRMLKKGQLKVGAKVEPDQAGIRNWVDNFGLYARRGAEQGQHVLDQNFQAALQTGSDPDGGYLVPPEVSQRIIKRVYETSPLRDLATVESIGGKELDVPRDEGEFGAGWVAETADRPETSTSQLGMTVIVAHEMYAAPRATQNMLEDAAINVESWIADKVADKFGRLEATAFLIGDGVGKPRGLLTYPNGTSGATIEQIVSGAATDFTFDGMINTVFSLKDPYANNASWLINRLGLRNIAKLKDNDGRYIWEMAREMTQRAPSMLLGYPVRRAADIAAPGASALMAAFGDFRAAYTIVDRLGITTLRDPYTAKPYVIFYSRRRVGGDVVNFEAVKLVVGST